MSKDEKTTSGGSDTVITSPMVDVKATSLFHALSEIEQFSAAELRTGLPDGVVPLLPRFSFMDVGFKNGAITTMVTFLLTPFSMAAIENIIPVFGSTSPSFLDQAFVYAFASAPAIAMAMLIAFISMKTYRGRITKSLINNLLFSYAAAKISASIFFVALGYFIYSRVFTPGVAYAIANTTNDIFDLFSASLNTEGVYHFLLKFRSIILKAYHFAALLHVGTALILLFSHFVGVHRTRSIEILRREWE